MKYCKSCKVSVVGKRKLCPLCQDRLSGDEYQDEVFPKISFVYREHSWFLKIMLLISIIVATVSLALNILLPGRGLGPCLYWEGLVQPGQVSSTLLTNVKTYPKT